MRRHRVPLLILICLLSTGCIKAWKPSPIGPRETLERTQGKVLLVLTDGSKVELSDPSVEGETVVSPVVTLSRTCLDRPDGTRGLCSTAADTTHVRIEFDAVSAVLTRQNSGWNWLIYTFPLWGLVLGCAVSQGCVMLTM